MEGLLTLKEASTRLGCTEAMLRKWLHQRRLPYVKVGRLTRLRESDLQAWVRVGLPTPQRKEEGR